VFVWGVADPGHADQAEMVEHIILAVFVAEMAIKLWSQRLAYFMSRWHLFDCVVIALALLPMLPGAAVLRLARISRLAKLLHLARHASALRAVELPSRRKAATT
jgi:hypothetical protein